MSLTGFSADAELLIIFITVAGITTLQILAVLAFLCYRNCTDKARWWRLRQRGIVIVNGSDLSMPSAPVQVGAPRLGPVARASNRFLTPEPQGFMPAQQHDIKSER